MKMLIAVAAFTAALNGVALADGKVDHSIDRAAARILAGRIGEIRGGFAPGVKPAFIRFAARAPDAGRPTVSAETTASTRPSAGPARPVWIDGLARARDPLAGRAAIGL